METFSDRYGHAGAQPEISIRDDAPPALRAVLVQLTYDCGVKPSQLRAIVCRVMFEAPNSNNWSEFPNVDQEVRRLLDDCDWWLVYDLIETIARAFIRDPAYVADPHTSLGSSTAVVFEAEINRFFRLKGIGWLLSQGSIEYRGNETFESNVRPVVLNLAASGRSTASRELHEAIGDLSRRPHPEITGSIQHALAALECVARDAGHTKDTLGEIVQRQPHLFPPPLGTAVKAAWGWSSNFGRHLSEGANPSFEEAELMVGLSGALCMYLTRRFPTGGRSK